MRTRNVKGSGYKLACLALSWTLALAAAGNAWAQQSAGSIAGAARDSTGAALPGVTVEAASPALIEGVKTAVTDGQGIYRIVDLRPGTYTVTFTLPGFSTFRREGITLSTGFTATVNGAMTVGALAETVTVTGASPLVDIQNTRVQTVLTEDEIDALPISKNITGFAGVTLGVEATNFDVGGSTGEASQSIVSHGFNSQQMAKKVDGMTYNTAASNGGGIVSLHDVNQAAMVEAVLERGASAEAETGGIQLNFVPKDGGNQLSVYFSGTYTDDSFVSSSLTDELIDAGLRSAGSIRKIFDVNGGVGGPIVRDRAWFYVAARQTDAQEFQPAAYFNKGINTVFYEPDLDGEVAYRYAPSTDISARVTMQLADKHRLAVSDSFQKDCQCGRVSSSTAPEAAQITIRPWGTQLFQTTWTYTASNRLLFQAGASFNHNPIEGPPMPADGVGSRGDAPAVSPDAISIFDSGLGVRYGAVLRGSPAGTYYRNRSDDNINTLFSVSYVTGTHSLKVGVHHTRKRSKNEPYILNDIDYTFSNQQPIQLRLWNSPQSFDIGLRSVALYAQDQWTIDRLSLNLGARYDRFTGKILAGSLPQRQYVPAFSWDDVNDVPNFNDFSARLGMAYDVFGDGRTAIKVSLGRYLSSVGIGTYASPQHPVDTVVASTNRTWTDLDGDFVPDCDQLNSAANGECGAFSNSAFGTTVPSTNFFLEDATQGFGNRGFNWQSTIGLNHELVPGVALDVTYFRNWDGNFLARDNTFVTPADYDEFCVTIPQDSRLPRSGEELCGLYDIDPALFGLRRTEVTQMSNFGEQTRVYNGVEIGVNARFGQGGFVQGGVSVGRNTTDDCNAIVDEPAPETAYCHVEPPWSADTQVKFSGAYPLPWAGIVPSFVYRSLGGGAVGANLRYTNAQVAPSLGRNLARGSRGTVNVPIVEPQTLFLDRVHQFDIRVSKLFDVGGGRIRAMLDIYNLLGARTIRSVSSTFGSSWQRPTRAMPGRLFKFGGTFEF